MVKVNLLKILNLLMIIESFDDNSILKQATLSLKSLSQSIYDNVIKN